MVAWIYADFERLPASEAKISTDIFSNGTMK
jgi:hypothetical protein